MKFFLGSYFIAVGCPWRCLFLLVYFVCSFLFCFVCLFLIHFVSTQLTLKALEPWRQTVTAKVHSRQNHNYLGLKHVCTSVVYIIQVPDSRKLYIIIHQNTLNFFQILENYTSPYRTFRNLHTVHMAAYKFQIQVNWTSKFGPCMEFHTTPTFSFMPVKAAAISWLFNIIPNRTTDQVKQWLTPVQHKPWTTAIVCER